MSMIRSMEKIVSNRLYLLTLLSDMISNFGDSLYYLALMTYVLELKQSQWGISIINISETLPVLLTIVFGYLADWTVNKTGTILTTLWIRIVLYLVVAVAMNFPPSITVVLLASFVNFISDTLGQFENGLFYPISNQIVKKSEREEFMAFRQTVTSFVGIAFQTVSAFLITLFSYSQLAVINALTFLVSFSIFRRIQSRIDQIYPVQTERSKEKPKLSFSSIVLDLKRSIHLLFQIQSIKQVVLVIPILNGSLSILTPLLVMGLARGEKLVLINATVTIAALSLVSIIGGILGGSLILISDYFKRLSVDRILKLDLLVLVFLFLSFYMGNIFLVFLCGMISSLFESMLNPKIGALIFKNIDENQLATTFGGMTTYFQLGDILSKLLFSVLIISLSFRQISLLYLLVMGLTLLVFVYLDWQDSR